MAGEPVVREASPLDFDPAAVEKGGYEHFMLKEIFEQPEALENCLRGRLLPEEGTAKLSGLRLGPREIAALSNVVLTACGTSYYAGLHGAYAFEQFAGIPARIEQAAEFRYRNPIVAPDTALVSLSQSGETADTLAAVREAKRKGALVLSVCNAVGSTIAREAGRGVYLHAGPEIGVASTKAFLCQVAALEMMALLFGRTRRLSGAEGAAIVRALASLPDLVRAVLAKNDAIARIAEKHAGARDAFYIGRGYQYPAALEGALKLKEISYLHAEGYHAAELKHGPIALLDEKVPVVALAPRGPDRDKTLGNIQECRARNAPVVAIVTEGDADARAFTEDLVEVPPCPDFVAAVPVVVAEQLFAYHVARLRGEPIDKPRNLAKSVTVE
jgi:glucosamine--fructose-6-phosphate aminotransferase (isomerizing)